MAEEKIQEDKAPDALGMSDEDIAEMTPEQFAEQAAPQDEEDPQEEKTPAEEEPAEEEEVPEKDVYADSGGSPDEEEDEPEEEDEDKEEPVEAAETESYETDGIDYKAQYDEFFKPFKASGREIKIQSIEDGRRLMQMGVDYQKKMRSLKPHLRVMKALEKNKLLDEDKINFFIDLEKKNPEAIAKFLKDKEIDPLSVDVDEGSANYKPANHTPSDQEVALDDVLDSIRETTSFDRTIDELGNKWDAGSKEVIMQHPTLIKLINDQVESGIYDQIMSVVDSERLLGRLTGLNDLMAYKTIGDALQEKGAFSHLTPETKPADKPIQNSKKLKERKRAAGAPKRTVPQKPRKGPNPLSLSDAEFEKAAANFNM